MIGPLDPDSLDPAVLRDGAELLENIAAQERPRADIIELSVFCTALGASIDRVGSKRGIDLLVELDANRAMEMLKVLYARVAALALQIAARD